MGKTWSCQLHAHLGGLLLSAVVYPLLVFCIKTLVTAWFEEMMIYLLVREWAQQGWPYSSDHGQIQGRQAHGDCFIPDRCSQQAVLGSPYWSLPHGTTYFQERHGFYSWLPSVPFILQARQSPTEDKVQVSVWVASKFTVLSHLSRLAQAPHGTTGDKMVICLCHPVAHGLT